MLDTFDDDPKFSEYSGLALVLGAHEPMSLLFAIIPRPSAMSTVQLRYDGWVTLPVAALKKFDLATGDRLEVELTRDAIVLRRAAKASAADRATAKPEPAAAQAEARPEPVAKRGPGRPRKTPVAALPPTLKTRGRRKAASTAEAPAH
jgi:bifunctional DNA-binding transcriptional regulator/antitoxin component of YhaV-PrlF toxin-antitoxin module